MGFGLLQGYHPKYLQKCKSMSFRNKANHLHGGVFYVIVKLLHSRVLRLVARIMLLGFLFVSLPILMNSIVGVSPFLLPTFVDPEPELVSDSIDLNALSLIFNDLRNEGLFKSGDRAAFITCNDNDHHVSDHLKLLENNVDLIAFTNFDKQRSIPDESFDVTFCNGFHLSPEFIDRTLKLGGVAIVQLSDNPSFTFTRPLNFKIVYVRRFESTILAMKKIGYISESTFVDINTSNLGIHRRLLGYANQARKNALKNLEDVLLEPPRAASRRSSRYLKKTRYLPDLTGDSLESYPRRVFIDVGLAEKEGGTGTGWFAENYPTRNLDFEVYKLETLTEKSLGKEMSRVEKEIGVSDWLTKNVKEEEYIVMKAEAEVVEEMMKSKAISLVDELFLECKPRSHEMGNKANGSKRAYWECLALYGMLRDEGVAVHQWWG